MKWLRVRPQLLPPGPLWEGGRPLEREVACQAQAGQEEPPSAVGSQFRNFFRFTPKTQFHSLEGFCLQPLSPLLCRPDATSACLGSLNYNDIRKAVRGSVGMKESKSTSLPPHRSRDLCSVLSYLSGKAGWAGGVRRA